MGYLEDFYKKVDQENYPEFLKIWEEYCYSDELNPEELLKVLNKVKESLLAESFGKHVTKILPLVKEIKDEDKRHQIIKEIFSIQNTNALQIMIFITGL